MSFIHKRWPKILILIIGMMLFHTKYTSADLLATKTVDNNVLRATTLDFSNRQTSNEFSTSNLFNVFGLITNGFQVESLRIKKEGEMSFNYRLNTINITGDNDLCQSLKLKIFKHWQIVFEGSLETLNYTSTINQAQSEDLLFVLSMNDPQKNLKNKGCFFDFLLRTEQLNNSNSSFVDEELLQNQVISGI